MATPESVTVHLRNYVSRECLTSINDIRRSTRMHELAEMILDHPDMAVFPNERLFRRWYTISPGFLTPAEIDTEAARDLPLSAVVSINDEGSCTVLLQPFVERMDGPSDDTVLLVQAMEDRVAAPLRRTMQQLQDDNALFRQFMTRTLERADAEHEARRRSATRLLKPSSAFSSDHLVLDPDAEHSEAATVIKMGPQVWTSFAFKNVRVGRSLSCKGTRCLVLYTLNTPGDMYMGFASPTSSRLHNPSCGNLHEDPEAVIVSRFLYYHNAATRGSLTPPLDTNTPDPLRMLGLLLDLSSEGPTGKLYFFVGDKNGAPSFEGQYHRSPLTVVNREYVLCGMLYYCHHSITVRNVCFDGDIPQAYTLACGLER